MSPPTQGKKNDMVKKKKKLRFFFFFFFFLPIGPYPLKLFAFGPYPSQALTPFIVIVISLFGKDLFLEMVIRIEITIPLQSRIVIPLKK
jgi:hypothetical protein